MSTVHGKYVDVQSGFYWEMLLSDSKQHRTSLKNAIELEMGSLLKESLTGQEIVLGFRRRLGT